MRLLLDHISYLARERLGMHREMKDAVEEKDIRAALLSLLPP